MDRRTLGINLKHKVFGRLTAIKRSGKCKQGVLWLCVCTCGNNVTVVAANLRRGHSRSCGCLRDDSIKARSITHGACLGRIKIPEYEIYCAAKSRCNNRQSDRYADYGGRGIKFNFSSFEEFLTCLGRRPSPELSLDRINNDGHYEPGNVRWATRLEQANNRRNSKSKEL